ncbi:phosphoglycerate dehydrogenase [Lactiplantibacillus mudanjiangensis]|uniref:3-phosphoglycerate dehydrogenase [Lactobacillus pentosus] n=1 Tax=Lactiplantibacillus mudanjiangensis TaxID=1296538 RepID=A0A660E0I3_9LACO|nr:phosphoglycerate dehydrogenase [Lactiplantibacillus mudanjiangensis]VDG18811.1 3-phosphoglycerate dehydrogenase [Lactobacillus pentosus] [Lactiplantibacillus mudanjiangensis]VDG25100.1 3-phosphoglycerate dehydrogenase [Lactobacillus pentosus] [Lactiplantibacillus mudanjiangensis]VDG28996.1 3-phosphoglycerate dehydrogenase [Lactobacillus pentosus] [Lactiplantibacillus mudanjiangensis]VDG32910.1 3-phosphoglycerate dehydrogenase [Lactobacillus pentosus] [Lactiplantibacillus mudanjiangensis]
MPIALMVQATKPDQFAALQQAYPEWTFKTPATLAPTEYADVQVMYGKHPLLTKILATPEMQLRFLQVISAGVDYLPLADLAAHHVLVANTSGIHADGISESVLGAMLTIVRGYQAAILNQQGDHAWALPMTTSSLAGQQLVIFGTGQIGQAIARKAAAFGMTIVGVNTTGHAAADFDTTVALADVDTTLKTAQFVVNALPLTPETTHYFNAARFAQMQQQPMFINIGRGPAVVTADLLAALNSGQLGHAMLDVTDPEPLPADHPLWQQPNVMITPHVSGQISHFRATVFHIFKTNFETWQATGKLARNQVDLHRGY